MTERIWHKGPPPHIGWWNCSKFKSKTVWRWWNGKYWSIALFENDPPKQVLCLSKKETKVPPKDLHWTDYWPENARVPRIDPAH